MGIEFENVTTEEDLANDQIRIRMTWEERIFFKLQELFPGATLIKFGDDAKEE